jgi:hypothetical protein
MQLGFLTWVPPEQYPPQGCRIALQGAGDTTLDIVIPVVDGIVIKPYRPINRKY